MVHILDTTNFDHQWKGRYFEFINCHPNANIYHTLEWHQVIQETYNYSPIYVLVEEDNRLSGVLPLFLVTGFRGRKLVSIPYSHWVPILADNDNVLQTLLNTAQQVCRQRKCRSVTLRHGEFISQETNWLVSSEVFDTILPLNSSLEILWKNSDNKSARWCVRRARRDGVFTKIYDDIEAYDTFYQLELYTRRRQASPIYPSIFFRSIQKNLAKQGYCQLRLSSLNDQIVGGTLTLSFNQKSIYGYAASIDDKNILRSRPMDLLIWSEIERNFQQEYKSYDFGTTPCHKKNLLHFKEKWGATTTTLPYYHWSPSGQEPKRINRESQFTKLVGKVLCKLPTPLYIWVSTIIMKQLG